MLTFALNFRFGGLDTTVYHIVNLGIHVACVLVVWLLLRRLLDRTAQRWALPGALLFAVHPVVVEPVAWLAGREELLMTLGALGCIHFHLGVRRLEAAKASAWAIRGAYCGEWLCCAAACLSNAVGAVIPLVTLGKPGK